MHTLNHKVRHLLFLNAINLYILQLQRDKCKSHLNVDYFSIHQDHRMFDISLNNAPLILCNTNKNLLLEKKKKKQKNQFMTNQHFRLQPSLNKEAHKRHTLKTLEDLVVFATLTFNCMRRFVRVIMNEVS